MPLELLELLFFPKRLVLGLVISTFIGLVAYRRGSLTKSGVLGAVITGTIIFGFGGLAAGLTLIAFFVSSSLLSHFKERDARKQRAAEAFDKGGRRDLGQALANGGAAAMLAIGVAVAHPFKDYAINLSAIPVISAMVGALATVTADTWATELGVLNKSRPRLITTFKQVEPGTSGAVSVVGLAAASLGAIFIAIFFNTIFAVEASWVLATLGDRLKQLLVTSVVLGGLAGSLFDSFLGATVQAMYFSATRSKETEKPFERDGTPNKPIRGWHWLNNDWVNFISSLFGAMVAAATGYLLIR